MRKKHKGVSGGGMKDSHCTSEKNTDSRDCRTTGWKTYVDLRTNYIGTPLVAHWIGTCLPMQEAQVQGLAWDDPTCSRATQLVCHNCWAHPLQGLGATSTEACIPMACALQQEKPPQQEARAPQWRGALLSATGESPAMKTQHNQKQSLKKPKRMKPLGILWQFSS